MPKALRPHCHAFDQLGVVRCSFQREEKIPFLSSSPTKQPSAPKPPRKTSHALSCFPPYLQKGHLKRQIPSIPSSLHPPNPHPHPRSPLKNKLPDDRRRCKLWVEQDAADEVIEARFALLEEFRPEAGDDAFARQGWDACFCVRERGHEVLAEAVEVGVSVNLSGEFLVVGFVDGRERAWVEVWRVGERVRHMVLG